MLATKVSIPTLWLHLVIQLGSLASFTVSNPYLQHAISPPSSSSRTEKRNPMGQNNIKVCGSDLSKKLGEICELFYSPMELNNSYGDLMDREGVHARCCQNECSETFLKSYCKKVRDRTISQGEEIQRSTVVDGMEQVVPPPPTDPPNVPEYVYAGEYWDQEPLTLISTYTSPEYSTNQLIF